MASRPEAGFYCSSMLDFYRISDSEPDPESPVDGNYAGSLGFDDVVSLASNPEFAFDYYADVRFRSDKVAVMYRMLGNILKEERRGKDDSPYRQLESILRAAAEAGEGIAAFGD